MQSELRDEFTAGQKQLAELETRKSQLQETLLRISGAVQVLEEELNREGETEPAEPAKLGAEF